MMPYTRNALRPSFSGHTQTVTAVRFPYHHPLMVSRASPRRGLGRRSGAGGFMFRHDADSQKSLTKWSIADGLKCSGAANRASSDATKAPLRLRRFLVGSLSNMGRDAHFCPTDCISGSMLVNKGPLL